MADLECFRHELALCDLAEPLGFDSIWQPETPLLRLRDDSERVAIPDLLPELKKMDKGPFAEPREY
jgi:hypothetical protein